ncbi:outer membrane lipoprotein chaperone LolA [Teredinibacter purpureus]|uniref:outer membrane lipoprotein chaperone LolA n=1 Tax=Teredinibacter purpureus TaxID=2731756 RepID=UPI00069830EE|nr:outer membrane lipoprotein chaperone LolA [Teredinibacter purpureus]
MMLKRSALYLCTFLALLSMKLYAQDNKVEAIAANELSAKLKSIQTFTASFEQSLTDPSGGEIQPSSGVLKVKNPGLFYWHVSLPYEQLVVANQHSLWVYDPDLEQATVSDRRSLDNSPAQILSGDFSSLGETFAVTVTQIEQKARYTLETLDLNASTFTQLVFEFTYDSKHENEQLASMSLVDKLGQVTAVTFSDQQLNTELPSSIFDFVAPEGVDIITNE